jgi:hypothetical protein
MISVIYERNKQYFQPLVFTFWHHENSDMASQMNENDIPFYKVFEKLNEI